MKPRNDVTPIRLLAILGASCIGVGLTGCGPGWTGDGTIVELELLEYENDGHRLTDIEGLEVTVATANGERAVQVDPACIRDLQIGQTLTRDRLVAQCGEITHSTDD